MFFGSSPIDFVNPTQEIMRLHEFKLFLLVEPTLNTVEQQGSYKEFMVIDKISPGKQAEKMPQLRLGLILKSVNGESVEHLSVADVSGLLQQRPVSCEFVYRTDDVKEGRDYLYGETRAGAMNLGFAARLHKKAQHTRAAEH